MFQAKVATGSIYIQQGVYFESILSIVNNVSLVDSDFSVDMHDHECSDSHTFLLKAMFLFPLVVARYVFFLHVL